MNSKCTKLVLFVAGMAALASCSTAYKMGQTPDDVYFSPAKPQSAYVASRDRDEDSYYSTPNSRNNRYNANQYDDPYYSGYDMYRNDRLLRMSIGNRSRWMGYNDYLAYDGFYNYNRYNMYSSFYYNSPMNPYFYWNSFYNPYTPYGYGLGYSPYYGGYGGIAVGGSKYPTSNVLPSARPRTFNPAGYGSNSFSNNSRYLNTNSYTNSASGVNGARYNNTNSRSTNSSRGNNSNYYNNSNNSRTNSFRTTSPNTNNSIFNNNSNSTPTRSYTPSSSGSSFGSGGSSSSGGGGGVSRPTRGGN